MPPPKPAVYVDFLNFVYHAAWKYLWKYLTRIPPLAQGNTFKRSKRVLLICMVRRTVV